jgi:predicted XRE-type DNA-binding protein
MSKNTKNIKFTKSSGNLFKDAGYSRIEAKNLQFRSYLMTALRKYILNKGWSQIEAAEQLEVTQPRVSNLIHGKIDLFSSGMLIEMLEKAGFEIYEKIEKDIDKEFKAHHWAHPLAEEKENKVYV